MWQADSGQDVLMGSRFVVLPERQVLSSKKRSESESYPKKKIAKSMSIFIMG